MPKIVDHDARRTAIAQQATELFARHGYAGLGMRKIAAELGVSKSALYHYFPDKEALFLACTTLATDFDDTETVTTLPAFLAEIDGVFPAEMALLFDYLRGRNPQDIATDPAMKLAMDRYRAQAETMGVDPNAGLATIMGGLMIRYFDGGKTSLADINSWL